MSESISRWALLQDWDYDSAMEFTLDFRFTRDRLEQERVRARDEVRDLGVLGALESSQHRHDTDGLIAESTGHFDAADYQRQLNGDGKSQ